jgi:hypothetical protein
VRDFPSSDSSEYGLVSQKDRICGWLVACR